MKPSRKKNTPVKKEMKEEEPEESEALKKKKAEEEIKRKVDDLGFNKSVLELPPEDVDLKEVEKSLSHTLKTFVPYTDAWYEAKAAEEALDGLKAIREEISEAKKYVAMARMGRHEEALEVLMDEAKKAGGETDFHYFNKLKNAEIEKGRFKYKPRNLNPFGDISSGKNRLVKALKVHFDDAVDSVLLKQINFQSRAARQEAASKSKQCPWRGKTKTGEELQCSNNRMVHPTRKIKDKYGKLRSEMFPECCYHLTRCSGDHIGKPPLIKIPNAEGLCTSCYYTKFKRKIPISKPEFVPGVIPAIQMGLSNSKDVTGAADPTMVCKWKPNAEESLTEKRGFICTNRVIIHPTLAVPLPFCGMHTVHCVRPHAEADGHIEIPNIFGLCLRHHKIEHGADPVPLIFPYVGMKRKMVTKVWEFKPDHWAAPTWFPQQDIRLAVYSPVLPPITRIDKLIAAIKNYKHNRKMKRSSEFAVIIQKYWRRYRVQNSHLYKKLESVRPIRYDAVILIQSIVRMKISRGIVQKRRELYNACALIIQRIQRGRWGRLWLKRDLAARCIQRFMLRLPAFNFKFAVHWTIYMRKTAERKRLAAIKITKFARMVLAMKLMVKRRKSLMLRNAAAIIIQRAFRKYFIYWPKPVVVVEPDYKAIYNLVMEQLLSYYSLRLQALAIRQEPLQMVVPSLQQHVRGYFARMTANMAKYVRYQLRGWVMPNKAADFMSKILENRLRLRSPTTMPKPAIKQDYISCLLPEDFKGLHRIPKPAFFIALQRWYDSCQLPLPEQEREALVRRYRNQEDNNIFINRVDDLVYLTVAELGKGQEPSPKYYHPCKSHGRVICGDCLFPRECLIKHCQCFAFVPRGVSTTACADCGHPPGMHRLCPLQLKPVRDVSIKATFQKLLKIDRRADIQRTDVGHKPVRGVNVKDIISRRKQKPNADLESFSNVIFRDSNENKIANISSGRRTGKNGLRSDVAKAGGNLAQSPSVPLERILSTSQVVGDKLSTDQSESYWNQKSVDLSRVLTKLVSQSIGSLAKSSSSTLNSAGIISNHKKNESRPHKQKAKSSLSLKKLSDSKLSYDLNVKTLAKIDESNIKPDIELTPDEFWRANPFKVNKSKRDVEEKFNSDVPISFVSSGEVVYSLEGSKIYLAILYSILELSSFSTIHADNSDFLRLISDHIQVFERHWRKMIIDFRDGELNRHVKIDPVLRLAYESKAVPRPDLADDLEKAFRGLGFNQKGEARDRTIVSYAQPKTPRRNDNSGPTVALHSENESNRITLVSSDQSNNIRNMGSEDKDDFYKNKQSISADTAVTLSDNQIQISSADSHLSNQLISSVTISSEDGNRKKVIIQEAQLSRKEFKSVYKQITAPEDRLTGIMIAHGRFLCPFPGCGGSFKTHEEAFKHLHSHERKTHLAIATPLADSMLSSYWPKDIPWQHDEKYSKEKYQDGKVACPVRGCNTIHSSKFRLQKHIRQVHKSVIKAAQMSSFFIFQGNYMLVPPFDPPNDVSAIWCPNHFPKYRAYCPLCKTVQSSWGPRAPFKFYEMVRVNFNHMYGEGGEIPFKKRDPDRGVLVFSDRGGSDNQVEWKGRVLEVVCDGQGMAWLAVERLFCYEECVSLGYNMPKDIEIMHELIIAPTPTQEWIRVDQILAPIFIITCTKIDFKYMLNNSLLPNPDTYFIRRQEPSPFMIGEK